MEKNKILNLFKKNQAVLEGHFLLSSGLHSAYYFQSALIFQNPSLGGKLSKILALKFINKKIDLVIGPALGGIIIAYEIAKFLKAKALFTERENEIMCLRRGFKILPFNRVLVLEDVITTGKSAQEVIQVVKEHKGILSGIGALIDRSSEKLDLPLKPKSLLKIKVNTYQAEECPFCKENKPLIKPGSRIFI